jgi:hypothetical protein
MRLQFIRRTLLAVLILSWSAATPATAGNGNGGNNGRQNLAFERTEVREDCDSFDRLRQPFYGDLHLHTALSYDSSLRFVRPMPRDAYAFAQGQPIVGTGKLGLPTRTYQISRPLDFGAVTDHAEHFGEIGLCKDIGGFDQPGKYSLDCQFINGFFYQPTLVNGLPRIMPAAAARGLAANFFFPLSIQADIAQSRASRLPVCTAGQADCDSSELAVWDEMQAAAEEAYDRTSACSFTSFVAYENSSSPMTVNWHRNVIFRNDRVIDRPITAIDMAQVIPNNDPRVERPLFVPPGPEPKIMWDGLQEQCLDAGNGCDVLTIPHNPNLGGALAKEDDRIFEQGFAAGLFFDPRGDTQAERRAYALQRQKFEPLVEMYQHKGNSECRFDNRTGTGTDTTDELCDFELLDSGSILDAAGVSIGGDGGGDDFTPPEDFPSRSYVRNLLKDGVGYEQSLGANPFKLGFISSTDSHNATMGHSPEDLSFGGHLAIEDAIPTLAIQNSSGGQAGVWAEENSRDAIFEALKRKETFATSGTRIAPRFFGSFTFNGNECMQNFVNQGYSKGVPMGGDLSSAIGPKSPSFIVQATADDFIGTPLQQLQVIKGWVDAQGDTHEAVYTVAGDPNNGASVDPDTCDPVGAGFSDLCTVFEDPDFDKTEPAYYYSRVIENPVCRFSTHWCKAEFGIDPLSASCHDQLEAAEGNFPLRGEEFEFCCNGETDTPLVQPVIQERAWTSPIWYTP